MSWLRYQWPAYPLRIDEMAYGAPFEMLNYDGVWIRVRASIPFRFSSELNDDGFHVPVVGLTTGHLMWMAKLKPCRALRLGPHAWTSVPHTPPLGPERLLKR